MKTQILPIPSHKIAHQTMAIFLQDGPDNSNTAAERDADLLTKQDFLVSLPELPSVRIQNMMTKRLVTTCLNILMPSDLGHD